MQRTEKDILDGEETNTANPMNVDLLSSQSLMIQNSTLCKETDGIPRVILATPCGGSSATVKFTQTLFEAHGYKIFNAREPFLRPNQKNKFMDKARKKQTKKLEKEPTRQEILTETLRLYNEKAVRTNKSRENILDQAICAARDCFGSVGKQVYPNGTESSLCFSRRSHEDEKILASFDPDDLLQYMRERKAENEARQTSLKHLYKNSIETYESLFAFEYADDEDGYQVFEKSVDAWCNFLSNFINVDRDIVESVLIPYINTRKKPVRQKKVIYNFPSIKDHLQQTEFGQYLRL
ncbi:predicted protein [Chaetoceros tenuissimus]|uniref:Uncharacterized protein n=1 Tax=Chaetoceros tenuissimus TaxID=426638 RepID=A0AAD3D8M4_9STRA|nr:predicted protein [Chaetoceros tenuissimus]